MDQWAAARPVDHPTRADPAAPAHVRVLVAASLRFLLANRHRGGDVRVRPAGGSSLGHLVESLGIPRTEIGALLVEGVRVEPGLRPRGGETVDVHPVRRPQPLPRAGFLLDVHFGSLARRMRLLGLDTEYRNDADDAELVEWAAEQGRVLLTQDRGLLRRRALPAGGYVRGSGADEQVLDVLDRFDPPLAPWTRCPACNGRLAPVAKQEVQHLLEPGTRRSYTEFSRCLACGRPYWRGAHAQRLRAIIATADSARAGHG